MAWDKIPDQTPTATASLQRIKITTARQLVANDTTQTVGGGNPYLKPEMAQGIDGSWEWYFTDAALASIGVFYRKVDDVLYDATTKVGDDRFDSAGIDRSNYDYATVLNGDDGEISGVEFAYMHQYFIRDELKIDDQKIAQIQKLYLTDMR